MRAAVGLTECLGLDGDRCIHVIPRQLEEAVDGGYFTDIPPNVVGLKNSFLVGLLSTFVFINFFILFHNFKQISLITIVCLTASGKHKQEVSY